MDPQTPRELGDIEDAEAERREPGRTMPVKKSLDDFLEEFEQRLRDSPGEPATSAQAALEGRARGVWRTPVEAGERSGRRPARRPPWRPDPDPSRETPAAAPVPATEPDPVAPVDEPVAPAAETDVATGESTRYPTALAETHPGPVPAASAGADAGVTPAGETAELAAAAGETADLAAVAGDGPATGRKRHRRHRRHRRH